MLVDNVTKIFPQSMLSFQEEKITFNSEKPENVSEIELYSKTIFVPQKSSLIACLHTHQKE